MQLKRRKKGENGFQISFIFIFLLFKNMMKIWRYFVETFFFAFVWFHFMKNENNNWKKKFIGVPCSFNFLFNFFVCLFYSVSEKKRMGFGRYVDGNHKSFIVAMWYERGVKWFTFIFEFLQLFFFFNLKKLIRFFYYYSMDTLLKTAETGLNRYSKTFSNF